MKNFIFSLGLLLIVSVTFAQQKVAKLPKLSPRTQQYMLQLKKANGRFTPSPDYVYRKTADGIYISAMIKVSAASAQADIEALGGRVNTKAGSIWTVQVPVNNLQAFIKTTGISYIELDEPVCMKLDSYIK